VSLGVDGMYVLPRTTNATDEMNNQNYSYKWSTYEVYAGPTIMLTGDFDHRGLYILPAIGYTGASITNYGTLNLSGSMNTFEARFTVGYQFVVKSFKFVTGGGLRLLNSSDIVVKDSFGNEVLREKSSSTGALALDLQAGYMF